MTDTNQAQTLNADKVNKRHKPSKSLLKHVMLKKVVATIATLGALAAPVAYSHSNEATANHEHHERKAHRAMKGHHGAKMLKKMKRYLELSDEQVTQIKTIRSQSKSDNETLRTQLKAFKEQVKSQQVASEFDEAAFIASYQQYQDTFAQLAMQKAKTRHAIFQVLTSEQQAKWQAFQEKRKARRSRDND